MQLTLEQIETFKSCLKRELSKRKWVYPKLIERQKLTPEKAQHEISTMEDMLNYFDYLQIHTSPEQQKLF